MNTKTEQKQRRETKKDREFLISMMIYAVEELERRKRRVPTREEVLDYLFSEARHDPEARDLERRLSRLLDELLH